MSQGIPFKYLDNPKGYCDSICNLIQDGNKEWQNVWRAAIKDLFIHPNLSLSPNSSINDINNLLKVIEKAFKEKNYDVRVQAFECWQFFITVIGSCEVSDKLLSVLLIPLCASNHSMPAVLRTKLQTWGILVNSDLILKPTIYKKAVPHILKTLYGHHNLTPAADIDDLTEACGLIYSKLIEKCLQFEIGYVITEYLEKAIPKLSKTESTIKIAKDIWVNVLEKVCQDSWPPAQFKNLMNTFENLISCNSVNSNILISDLLEILIENYGTFPVGYFVQNAMLLIRCLFHISESDVVGNIMDCLLKKSQNGTTFFCEIVKIWNEFAEKYKSELLKNWIAVKKCFLKWVKANELPPDGGWVLLLPIKYLHDQWNTELYEELRSCYYELCFSKNSHTFTKNLLVDLSHLIIESENVPSSQLNASVHLCKIVLLHYSKYGRNTDAVFSVSNVLNAIFDKMPSQDADKSFAPGYVATVLFFMKIYPESVSQFAPIIRKYSSFINENEKGSSEIMSKYRDENGGDNESILKLCNDINKRSVEKADIDKTKVFLPHFLFKYRSTESNLKSEKLSNNTNKSRSTCLTGSPKSQNAEPVDDDIQFIMIKPKPKSSPLTEHQKEIAKSRKYIPALYEDLSQSQSQSLTDSASFTADKIPTSNVPSIDCIEENANLPPAGEQSINETGSTPKMLCDASLMATTSEKSNQKFVSKKSLFNANEKSNYKDNRAEIMKKNRGIEDIQIGKSSSSQDLPIATRLRNLQTENGTLENNNGLLTMQSRTSQNKEETTGEKDVPVLQRFKKLQTKAETAIKDSGPLSVKSKTTPNKDETSNEEVSASSIIENPQSKNEIRKQNEKSSSLLPKNTGNKATISNTDKNNRFLEQNNIPLSAVLKNSKTDQTSKKNSGPLTTKSKKQKKDDASEGKATVLKNLQTKVETAMEDSGPLSVSSKTPRSKDDTSIEKVRASFVKNPQNKIKNQDDKSSSVLTKITRSKVTITDDTSTYSRSLSQKRVGDQQQTETSTTNVTPDSQKKRGRPRKKSLSADMKVPKTFNNDVINLTDNESQNLFVTTATNVDKSIAVSSPLSSLMDLKQADDGKKKRRKSLKSKNVTPLRSPIATRKRKSMTSENMGGHNTTAVNIEKDAKKLPVEENDESSKTTESASAHYESSGSETSKRTAEVNRTPEKYENTLPIVRVSPIKLSLDGINSCSSSPRKMSKRNDDNTSPIKRLKFDEDPPILKAKENTKNSDTEKMIFNEETNNHANDSVELCSADTNCSVIIIEDQVNPEVISLDTDVQQSEPENVNVKQVPKKQTPEPNPIEDTSTYFESSENMIVDDSVPNNINRKNEEMCVTEDVIEECTQTDKNESSNEKQVEESEKIGLNEENAKVNAIEIAKILCTISGARNNEQAINSSPEKVPSSPSEVTFVICNSAATKDAEANKNDPSPSPEEVKADTINDKNTESRSGSESKNRATNEKSTKMEVQPGDAELLKTNTSPIASNTRTSRIMRLAYDSQNLLKTKSTSKANKIVIVGNGTGSLLNFKGGSINQRTKILMANGVAEKVQSPNKTVTTPTERLKYMPKECTSPGILKKPDLNGSFSSPKSAKFVNFAEQLTDTCIYECDDEIYDDSPDDQPTDLIGDDKATSQEILYPHLQNCKDDIEPIVKQLSMNDAGLNLFHRMGIRTVGDLASISTLAAKSIPAGDNRLQRLRKALKDYDDYRSSVYESKGLRAPSARRRILDKNQISLSDISIIELLDEIETTQIQPPNGSSQNEEKVPNCNVMIPAVVIKKLNDESCANMLKKQKSPTKPSSAVVISIVNSPVSTSIINSPPIVNSPLRSSIINPPPKESISSSPTKEPVSSSLVKESSVVSPARDFIVSSSVKKSDVNLPVKKPVLETNKSETSNVIEENVSSVTQELTSKEMTIPIEIILHMSDSCATSTPVAQMEVDGNVYEDVGESQHDTSDDVDFVCTNDEVVPPNTTYSRLCSRLASTRVSFPHSNTLTSVTTTVNSYSPEIITVEKDDPIAPRESNVAREAETENSISIFSPDVTNRTKQLDMEIESSNCSQSLLDASERLTTDDTTIDVNENDTSSQSHCEIDPAQTEDIFCKIIRTMWDPVLQNSFINTAISDEATVFATCKNIFRSLNGHLCQKLDSGGLDRTTLQEMGLIDLTKTLVRLTDSAK